MEQCFIFHACSWVCCGGWAACGGESGASQQRGEVEGVGEEVGGKGRRGSLPPAKFIFADCSGRWRGFLLLLFRCVEDSSRNGGLLLGLQARLNIMKLVYENSRMCARL